MLSIKTLDVDGTYWICRDIIMGEYTFEFVFGPHMQRILQDNGIDDKSDDSDEQDEVSFIHMARTGIHMEHVECTQALVDSGANVTMCPPELITTLQLTVMKSWRPLAIDFANGTITHSDVFVDLGPFLGLTYVLDNVNSVIVSCSRANARGFSFWLSPDFTCRIFNNKMVVVAVAHLRQQDQLYYIDVCELMQISSNGNYLKLQQ
jgi:hypothetical protein